MNHTSGWDDSSLAGETDAVPIFVGCQDAVTRDVTSGACVPTFLHSYARNKTFHGVLVPRTCTR